MIFFTDENVPSPAAKMLEIFDSKNEIRLHCDHFEQGTPDKDWLVAVSEWDPKPIVVGGDGRILRNPAEQVVFRDCDLMFVYLAKGWTNLNWNDWAWKIIKVWPDILRNVSKVRHPTVFEVNVSSLKIQRLFRTNEIKIRGS